MRWIWIDKFVDFVPGVSATAVKNVSLAEEHLHDQYAAFPIVPHSLIIEGMAQTGGILVGHARDFSEKVILAKIGRATFHRLSRPGDTLRLQLRVMAVRPSETRPDRGIITNRFVTVNQRGEPVQEMVASAIIPKRNPEGTTK